MLDPNYNLAGIAVKRRKPNKWFKRGTLNRRALDVLRMAGEPMTAGEIGAAILKAHGVEDASPEEARNVSLGIQHSLANHDGKGVQRVGEARPYRWQLSAEQLN
ncbi:hypothetical protein [Bradyrhizobium sp. SZCCHNR1070]|uniref:hypothetical protein n=1 Tax=Bradyrhizobium sp. SZCCHNR1070 TaxID=3057361 RepID=UPI002916545F|nr:hypothetical protein [Bradyrhizobium sp. SZCCHNR1070]